MKMTAVRKLHPMTFQELRLLLNQWVVANLDYMQFELPDKAMEVLLDISPTLFQDASLLLTKLKGAKPDKVINLNDTEFYTLYLGYDLLGRLLSSSYRDQVMTAFSDDEEVPLISRAKEKMYRLALVNIGPMLKDSDAYARQHKCLKELPVIKRKLKGMPVFD